MESCQECGDEIASRNEAFETPGGLLCGKCFITRAQKRRPLLGQDRERLRKAVKEELAGVLPREALKDLLEDGYRRILIGKEDMDVVVGSLTNEIERMTGLALCRRMLETLAEMRKAMDKGIEGEDADVRTLAKRLSDLGTQG